MISLSFKIEDRKYDFIKSCLHNLLHILMLILMGLKRFNKRYFGNMINEQELLEYTITKIKKYGQKYAYLIPLITAKTWQEFADQFETIGKQDFKQKSKMITLPYSVACNIQFFLHSKLKCFNQETIDLGRLMPAFRYLIEDPGFNYQWNVIQNRSNNLFHLYEFLKMERCNDQSDSDRLQKQFYKEVVDTLFSQAPDKQSRLYKCVQKLSQAQRNKLQIIALNAYIEDDPRTNQDQAKQSIIFDKNIGTSDTSIFSQLLRLSSDQMEQVIKSIHELKLVQKEGKWQLQGECKVHRNCLTSQLLVKSLFYSKMIYHYLAENLLIYTESENIFKYDIELILQEKIFLIDYFFNAKTKVKKDGVIQLIKKDLQTIIKNSFNLINDAISNKKLLKFVDNRLVQIQKQRILLLSLKFLTYPFRTKYTFEFQMGDDSWDGDDTPTVTFDINQEEFREAISKLIGCFINEKQDVDVEVINALFELIRWIQDSKNHKNLLQNMFYNEDKEKDISPSFINLILTFAKQQDELPYHMRIWLLKYLTKQLANEHASQLYPIIYSFLVQNFRYFTIIKYQLDFFEYNSTHKLTFYQYIQAFLNKNPEFIKSIIANWIKQLQFLQKDNNQYRKDQKYRLAILIIIFNHQSFPQPQIFKEKMKKLLGLQDFETIQFKDHYKFIWQDFVKKIGLDIKAEVIDAISNSLVHTQDLQIIAKNYDQFYTNAKPQNMKEMVKALTKLNFLLKVEKVQLQQSQTLKMVDIMWNLSIIQSKYRAKLEAVLQQYTKDQLEFMRGINGKSFRSFYCVQFLQRFSIINDFLKTQTSNIQTENAIIIHLGAKLKYLKENSEDLVQVIVMLQLLKRMLRNRSRYISCELFVQFYNYNKQLIIDIIQEIFLKNGLKYYDDNGSEKQDEIQFALKVLKQGKNIKQQRKIQNLKFVYFYLKNLINQLFSNQNWEDSVFVNNIKYDETNNLSMFQKTMQDDFANRIIKRFQPERIKIYYAIFKIINDSYHRILSREDLDCSKTTINVEIPSQPLVVMTLSTDLQRFQSTYKNLILKSFENWQFYEDCAHLEDFYNVLAKQLQDEHKTKIQKQIFQYFLKILTAVMAEENLPWNRYEKIHLCINYVVNSFDDPIGTLISKEFVQAYFTKLQLNLQKGFFTAENSKPFLNIVQRMVPDSKPEIIDEDFNKFMKYLIQICVRLSKDLKTQDIQQNVISLMAKIIRVRDISFNQQLIKFFQNIQGVSDTFSELFCQLIEKQLRPASIQSEIKSYFFKLHTNSQENRVKLSTFANTFSMKYNYLKKQFIKVAQKLTSKLTVNEQQRSTKYLAYNFNQKFQHSLFLGTQWNSYNYDHSIKAILSSLIKSIDNTAQNSVFGQNIGQLRIIIYNYPILAAFILMHPKQYGQSTVPFVDYLFHTFNSKILDEDFYNFFAYMCLDVGYIIKHENQSIFFSEYLCYRLVSKLMGGEITNFKLVFIYYMLKVKRFSDFCLKKIKDGKSLCDLIWDKLSAAISAKSHQYTLAYIILSILYRQQNIQKLFKFCEYKKKIDAWDSYNSIVNSFYIPFQNLLLKESFKQNEEMKISDEKEWLHKQVYLQFEANYQKWYHIEENKGAQNIQEGFKHKISQIRLKDEHLKHLGSIAKTHGQQYCDIQSQILNQYSSTHREAFCQAIHLCFLERENQNQIIRRRRRIKDNQYIFFEELHLEENHGDESEKQNEQRQEQFNIDRQSNFAPQEFVRVRNRKPSQDAKSQDLEKQLQGKLNEFDSIKMNENNVLPDKQEAEQFTQQMTYIFSKINQRLVYLQKSILTINEIQGKNLSQKLQFLQSKDLQTDFDIKQATMTIDQFQNYCLSNVSKLDRLNSDRRNIVRNMEDAMLMKFVQRSMSSDSVDYIIDTIDQNYQLLPNTLQNKLSIRAEDDDDFKNKKSDLKQRYINSINIPLQNYEDISDDRLKQLFMSLYLNFSIFSSKNLVPFIQNKRIQQKIINTLLYIYKNPLQNSHFPNKIQNFDVQNLKWNLQQNKQNAQSEIRQRILCIFIAGKRNSFYEDDSYLNHQISFKGIKDIVYEPAIKVGQQNDKYKPINHILEIIISSELKKSQKDQSYDCNQAFGLFKGVTQTQDSLLQKIISLLKEVHKKISYKVSNQSYNIDYEEIALRINQVKQYDIESNLKKILENEKLRNAIRQAFPIETEDRDATFVYMFMNTGVYTRQQLLKFHRAVIQKDVPNSSNVHFSNMAFKLYTQQELKECSWVKESKNIMPCIVKSLPRKGIKLKQQPFYRLCMYPEFLVLQFKSQLLYRKVKDYQADLRFTGSEDVVAKRKKGIFESAFLDLRNKPDGFWYQNFSVKFMNQAGTVESGYGRGVAKDWYAFVTKGMANLNYAIFMKTSKNYYFFNRESWINPRHLQFLQFIGKLFALSIINRQFYLAPSFSILIYKMIAGEKIEIQDIIKQFDEGQVIKNIQKLRQYHDDSLFCETFVYEDKRLISNRNLELLKRKRSIQAMETNKKEANIYLLQEAVELKQQNEEPSKLNEVKSEQQLMEEQQAPKMIKVLKIGQSIELIPGGAEIAVNRQNLDEFISLTKQKIYDTIVNGVTQQFNAFMSGFKRVVNPEWMKNISAEQLRQIAEGCDKISVEDLKKYVNLSNGVDKTKQIQWFWSSLQSLSPRDRMYLIQHWTGLPKISAEGFKGTNLQIVRGNYEGRLFAQTCFNRLHLPEFQNKEKLDQAMKMVINSVKIGESIIED